MLGQAFARSNEARNMDTTRRDQLIRQMEQAENSGLGLPLVTLEDFFVGNDQCGSICPHVEPQPSPSDVFVVFNLIRENTNVDAVFVMPTQIDSNNDWPFSDTVWIITSLSENELRNLIPKNFWPSEFSSGWPRHFKVQERPVPEGMRPVAAWYD
jgi:hypothetical protein